MIKNALDADNDARALVKHQRWRDLPKAVKDHVKADLVPSLSASQAAPRTAAAQAIAKLGKIEVPEGAWPELVDGLVGAAMSDAVPEATKTASLTAIGFLCEEIDEVEKMKVADREKVLSAIVTNMASPLLPVRTTATRALLTALDFAETSFSDAKAHERDAIMNAVMAVASDPDLGAQVAAFDCLQRTAECYYTAIHGYMDRLAGITSAAAMGKSQDIVVRALEFWSAVAQNETAAEEKDNKGVITRFAVPLVKLLTPLMAQVEEDDDDDEYSVAQAAAVCLNHCAAAAGDAVVGPTMEFVGTSFASPDWHHRDAATVAFGCILKGPDPEKLKPLIGSAMGTLIARLAGAGADASPQVRDSTAWVLCVVMEEHFDNLDLSTHFAPLLAALFAAIADKSRVAAKAAAVIRNLAGQVQRFEADGKTPLTPYFTALATALLERGDRPDWNEHKLRTACWEGVAALVSDASAEAEHPYLHTLLAEVGRRLTAAVTAPPPTTADAAEDLESRLVLLTAMLQDIVSELDEEVAPLAGSIGDLLIKVLSARKSFASESAFFALSALCDAVGEAFQPLLPACMPLVMRGVTDVEHNSAYSAIMAAGVLIRCGPAGVAYVDELVTEVLKALSNPEVPRNAKAAALAVFGDIAVAMGPQVSKFVAGIMGMLGRAAGTDRESDDEDDIDYLRELRNAVLEAWSGLLQAFLPEAGASKAEKEALLAQAAVMAPYLDPMMVVLKRWLDELKEAVEEELMSEEDFVMLKNIFGVIGDAASLIGTPNMARYFKRTEPLIAFLAPVCDKYEREQWDSEHDSAGKKRKSIAEYARSKLP